MLTSVTKEEKGSKFSQNCVTSLMYNHYGNIWTGIFLRSVNGHRSNLRVRSPHHGSFRASRVVPDIPALSGWTSWRTLRVAPNSQWGSVYGFTSIRALRKVRGQYHQQVNGSSSMQVVPTVTLGCAGAMERRQLLQFNEIFVNCWSMGAIKQWNNSLLPRDKKGWKPLLYVVAPYIKRAAQFHWCKSCLLMFVKCWWNWLTPTYWLYQGLRLNLGKSKLDHHVIVTFLNLKIR